jgi:hypothetical protein
LLITPDNRIRCWIAGKTHEDCFSEDRLKRVNEAVDPRKVDGAVQIAVINEQNGREGEDVAGERSRGSSLSHTANPS